MDILLLQLLKYWTRCVERCLYSKCKSVKDETFLTGLLHWIL